MKRALPFLFLLIFNGITHAQLVQSELIESWQNNAWQNSSKYTYAYDSIGNLTSQRTENWDRVSQRWINTVQMNYVFNTLARKTNAFTYQYWDTATGQWLDRDRFIYDYLNSNKIASLITQKWVNGVWYDADLVSSIYDKIGNLLRQVEAIRDSANHSWKNTVQIQYSYNSKGLLSQTIWQNWDSLASNNWANASKWSYTMIARVILYHTIMPPGSTQNGKQTCVI